MFTNNKELLHSSHRYASLHMLFADRGHKAVDLASKEVQHCLYLSWGSELRICRKTVMLQPGPNCSINHWMASVFLDP